jgi:hypothetical protein
LVIDYGLARRILEYKDGIPTTTVKPTIAVPAHIISSSGNMLLIHHVGNAGDGAEANYGLCDDIAGNFTAVYDSTRNEIRFGPLITTEALIGLAPTSDAEKACILFVEAAARKLGRTAFIITLRDKGADDEQIEGPTRFLLDEENFELQLLAVLLLFAWPQLVPQEERASMRELKNLVDKNLPGWDPITAALEHPSSGFLSFH